MTHNAENTIEKNDFAHKGISENVVKVKKKSRKIPKCVREDEFIELIKATPIKDYVARIGFLLAYSAGMRVSEVLKCKPDDFRPNSIFIPESKYGVERIVPIPKGWKQDFLKKLPLKCSIRTMQRKFEKYAASAKLPEFYSFHSLRHGFATRCLEKGMPINQVQVLLGHANIATTSVYTKANPIDAIKSFERLF
jgi:integrase/recombinase XerD